MTTTDPATGRPSDGAAAFSHPSRSGRRLAILSVGALGIVYPSVRHQGGTCLACFRPALVNNVRKHARYRFTWANSEMPVIDLDFRY